MIIEEFHPEEMQAFATRGPPDEGSMQFPLGTPLLAGFWQVLVAARRMLGQQLRNHAIERILEVQEPGYFSDVASLGLAE
jgi:hypothetical protein